MHFYQKLIGASFKCDERFNSEEYINVMPLKIAPRENQKQQQLSLGKERDVNCYTLVIHHNAI